MKIFHGESKLPFFVETPPAKQFKSQEPCHTQACEMIYAGVILYWHLQGVLILCDDRIMIKTCLLQTIDKGNTKTLGCLY